MREEKKLITKEYVDRLSNSPYFIVVNYEGLKVDEFEELRDRLANSKAELHVVKNSIFKIAVQETGIEDLGQEVMGQVAAVTGEGEITSAAKVLKNFKAEFEKPEWHFGFLDNERLDADQIKTLAELPSLDELRAKILGTIQAPSGKLVRTLAEPGSSLARIVRAKFAEN
ncbi:MAG: 50S ribosomal protein L10 [Verrucomicrobiota bacterium]|jgi:large subunit ribosomal protein L10|nr:50S ribosomal protein L10 [Verrucomicrobiota bacterium]